MIGLSEYIAESVAREHYEVLLDHVEIPKIPSESKLKEMIKEGIEKAISRYKVLRIKALEELNEKILYWDKVKLKNALIKKEKEVIAHMQTKPGIMKRSEEKRQKYIQDRLNYFKEKKWQAPVLRALEYDENTKIKFYWHGDIYFEQEYKPLRANIEEAAAEVAEKIITGLEYSSEDYDHLIAVDIAVNDDGLTTEYEPSFHIIPMFDKETEKKLSNKVKGFADRMEQEYNSGKYMGD